MKVLVIGGPRSGKSTFAVNSGLPVFCTDPKSLVKEPLPNVTYLPEIIDWSNQSNYVCENWFKMNNDFIIEGVGAVRALRKWVKMWPHIIPFDKIYYFNNNHPSVKLLDGQSSMYKAINTIYSELPQSVQKYVIHKKWTNDI